MRVVVTGEARFCRTPDGAVWSVEGPTYSFWTRYLSAFDQVRVVARVQNVPDVGDDARRVDGPDVEVWAVPYYLGPREYLTVRRAVHRSVAAAAEPRDTVILRVPSLIGTILANVREKHSLPYALEVVGDPADVLSSKAVSHPLNPLFRRWFTTRMKQQCLRADAVSYVTERSLQARYPARPGSPVSVYSSINLPPNAFLSTARTVRPGAGQVRLISVGTLARPHKGIDTLLEALSLLARSGLDVGLVHIGDGLFRPRLEQLAAQLRVDDRVRFLGTLPSGEPVRRQLDAADLFVHPSRAEGLPRALIEAMARGLPAVATRVGGIPELLPDEDLVPPDDPPALADGITRMLRDPELMAAASARNLTQARQYAAEVLAPRRDSFYWALRSIVADGTQPTAV
ncbi:glycosyltransferase family 4 protein [Micromonospora sp. KC606]|uniref:glycosyltransferase family 4 protein n=1 Tax=Micromonospora sp. KC606 TaxID=2530379 RepID=UPI001404EDC2|nr:glycosyltransferase family 4 protein [Micromonospora sp. KC606]